MKIKRKIITIPIGFRLFGNADDVAVWGKKKSKVTTTTTTKVAGYGLYLLYLQIRARNVVMKSHNEITKFV
jgi:hypothetical protein